jgi:hypothetical protein
MNTEPAGIQPLARHGLINNNIKYFMNLKNDDGENVFKLDWISDDLYISPLVPLIDLFDTLTLHHNHLGDICRINLSEVFVDALVTAMERCTHIEELIEGESIVDRMIDVHFLKKNIKFRGTKDCFPMIHVKTYNAIMRDKYVPANHIESEEEKSELKEDLRKFNDFLSQKLKDAESALSALKEAPAADREQRKKPAAARTKKTRLNDPCPCGKINEDTGQAIMFKKCCGGGC